MVPNLLLSAYLDDDLSDAEAEELRAWLSESPANVDEFVRRCQLHWALHELTSVSRMRKRAAQLLEAEGISLPVDAGPGDSLADAAIMPALHLAEPPDAPKTPDRQPTPAEVRDAAPVDAPPAAATGPAARPRKLPRPRFSTWRIAAALLVVCTLAAAAAVRLYRGRTAPASVVASVDAVWDDPELNPKPGDALPSREVGLLSGFVQIRFADGATALVEGPSRLRVASASEVRLTRGKLTAHVPAPAIGFTIVAPAATITDLGTEFGVQVNADGLAEVAVFKGRVRASPGAQHPGAPQSPQALVLTEGQAANVSPKAVSLRPAGVPLQQFVRRFTPDVNALDLVDLVAGGDGTTHRRGVEIDVQTGATATGPDALDYAGDGAYRAVAGIPVVDGCFVPDGSAGRVRVDSVGHTADLPATSNASAGFIWAGGPIIPPAPGQEPMATTLAGIDYAAPGHGHLAMHANKGLTIDLVAVRRLYPGRSVTRFRCIAGNTAAGFLAKADVSVLVDGRPAFSRDQFLPADGAFPIDVRLTDADSFLTLVTTDGGDDIQHDWVIFGDPVLELGQR